MKLAFILGLQFLALTVYAGELEFTNSEAVDNYFVQVDENEKITIEVKGEEHFSCWKNFAFKKLENQNQSDVIVLREPLAHPAVVCDFPVKQKEGFTFVINNSKSYNKYLHLQVPTGLDVKIVK